MALNFYNTVDLQENQLLRAAINNVSGEPADGARGELIYDYATGVNKLKVCVTASTNSSNAVWEIVGSQGDIQLIQASSSNDELGIVVTNGSGPTTSIGVDINSLDALSSLSDDDTFALYDDDNTKNVKVDLKDLKDYIGAGDVEGIDAGDGIVVNDGGTATPEVAVKFSGATDNVVTAAGDETGNSISTSDIIIYADSDDSDAVKKGLVSDLPFGTSNYAKWVVRDNQGTPASADVDSGDIVIVAGGTVLNTVVSNTSTSPHTVTINHDDLTVTTTDSGSDAPGYGGTITVVTGVTGTSQGHLDTITTADLELPSSVDTTYTLDKAANDNTLILAADGSTQDSIEFTGTADQIDIDVATEDAYTFSFPTAGFIAPDGSTATTQSSGDNSTKLATTAFVQTALTSALKFVDGFNANTGDLDSSSGDLYTDVDVSVGDFFVVTTPGNFFGNANTPLTNGDQVICVEAESAGSVVEADFVVVQSDTDLATYAAPGLANVNIGEDGNTAQVPSGFVGSSGGAATGGPLQIVYDSGTAILSSRLATSALVGLGNVTAGSGISVSYSAGTATITNSAQSEARFKKVSLNSNLSYITAGSS